VKTFRRRVRSASRRVGGSNCDLKSNLSSFLFFTVQFATVYASAFMHSKSVETFSNEKKFVFVRCVTSIPLCFHHSVGNHICKVLSEHQPTLKKVFFLAIQDSLDLKLSPTSISFIFSPSKYA
jgi:hypothetical protein